ncbi:MAG: CPBP family intramembrane glutamic endopeptidase [Verrucomicrobiales bacterium]
MVVLPAMVVPLLMSWLYFVVLPGTAVGNGLYTLMKILLVVWPILATRLVLGGRMTLKLWEGKPTTARFAVMGLALGLAILVLMAGLMQTPLGDIVREGALLIKTRVEGMGVLNHFLAFALFLSVVHSLIEEVYWRWFVYGNLRLLTRPWIAHVAAALAFSSHHIVVLSQFFSIGMAVFLGLCVGVGGGLWSLLFSRQQSLLGAWMSHMLVDLGIMTIGARLMGLL